MGIATSAAAPEPLAFIKSWSASFQTDKQEVTAFGDNNKSYVVGLPDAQGDFDGYFDDATQQTYTAAIDGQPRKFYLYPDATNNTATYWYGSGFFDFSASGSVDGANEMSASWVASGAITRIG
jgi:hypothetical protein